MKVLVTIPSSELVGGVANYFRELRPHLPGEVEYFVVGARDQERGTMHRLARLLEDYGRLISTLQRGHYDLVHINPSLLYGAFLRDGLSLLIAKLHRKPVVVMFHGWDKAFERTIEHHLLWLFRLIYGNAKVFVVLADEFKEKLRRWGCRQPIIVETMIVDDGVMDIPSDALSTKRKDSSTLNVLFLARVEKEKGIYETLDAFATLKEGMPHARLVIAGDGPELLPAMGYARDRGINGIKFLGFVAGKQKEEVFVRGHVYLFPTYGEGMPNSVLEAMAYGLPVITRPVGGLRDFFEDGRMGYLTESLDPKVFAELVGKLAGDMRLRETMGEYNRHYARERFAASKVAARLENIYASVLAVR